MCSLLPLNISAGSGD
ncbi:hypothetical protein MXF07_24730 [Klebsiella pneumoniae]|nr:hypothetical protein [Klebsiella pneumoniae]MEB5826136.1 hypothetical protein [Klebsiella pneumoniae]